ncbi:MAG: hypothetical protein JST43_03400 [Bacteroidetes bacterium]|nr:hypothetical protein [Bacteroidota bacterium]MBS1540227.1 hypothetical protein [Bacteroidota bacterium]
MNLLEFKASLNGNEPPAELSQLLKALWYDAQGDWHRAHALAQEIENEEGAWVHGYLHRKEGDISNARYWYQRAGRKLSSINLKQEWEEIAAKLLNRE